GAGYRRAPAVRTLAVQDQEGPRGNNQHQDQSDGQRLRGAGELRPGSPAAAAESPIRNRRRPRRWGRQYGAGLWGDGRNRQVRIAEPTQRGILGPVVAHGALL